MGMVPRVLNFPSFSPVEHREDNEENGNGHKGVELGNGFQV